MPTSDPSNVLFKIAHPDLYERNPFNLLNLSVNATARDIRRRKEDIEAAFEAGTEADEFRSVLPIDEEREPPPREAVDEAFAALEDPEMRMAYALFWFWPASENIKFASSNEDIAYWIDNYGKRMASGWRTDQAPMTPSRCHNLAVMHHMKALATELSSIAKKLPCANTKEIDDLWKSAIKWWNAVTADADFWHTVADMVSTLNDPRLDYRFARSLRDQFAFAFDQINVELAIDFAKAGCDSEAKRQVEYMKLSQPDADDVEGTFDDAFSGLLRQTEAICKTARAETDKNPTDGLHQANLILEQTDELLRVSRIVLEKGTPVRNAIVTTIFSAVRNCLIAYGNKTQEWGGCLELCAKLKALAETPAQEKSVAEDGKIITTNMQQNDLASLRMECWLCKSHDHLTYSSDFSVPMYGNVVKNGHRYTWKSIKVPVPICAHCLKKYKKGEYGSCIAAIGTICIGACIGAVFYATGKIKYGDFWSDGVAPGALWGFFASLVIYKISGGVLKMIYGVNDSKIDEYPEVTELERQGYEIGEKPPQVQ